MRFLSELRKREGDSRQFPMSEQHPLSSTPKRAKKRTDADGQTDA